MFYTLLMIIALLGGSFDRVSPCPKQRGVICLSPSERIPERIAKPQARPLYKLMEN